jgi:hypothetical protein
VCRIPSFVRTDADRLRWDACWEVAEDLFAADDIVASSSVTPPATIGPREAILGAAIVLFRSDLPLTERNDGAQRPRASA